MKRLKEVHLSGGDMATLESKVWHRFVCCDCALVHDFRFNIYDDFIMVRVKGNKKATREEREKCPNKLKKA